MQVKFNRIPQPASSYFFFPILISFVTFIWIWDVAIVELPMESHLVVRATEDVAQADATV